MAEKIYTGVNGTAKEVKKIYVGVNGVAKEVKKVYAGVNNVAQLCFDNTVPVVSGYSFDDLVAYANQIKDNPNVGAYAQRAVLNIIERETWLRQQIDLTCTSYVAMTESSSITATVYLYYWHDDLTVNIPSTVNITPATATLLSFADYRNTSLPNWKIYNYNQSFLSKQKNSFFGLVKTESVLPQDNTLFLQNQYTP